MRGQSEATVDMEWETATASPCNKEVSREQSETRYNGLEKRDTYRFNLSHCYPIKLTMIIGDIILKKGIIKDLSAGGLTCDFFEPINLSISEQVHFRFQLVTEETAIIKTEAIYLGVNGSGFNGAKIHRFDFSETISESDQDRIHQYILIKQLEIFRANRQKLDHD